MSQQTWAVPERYYRNASDFIGLYQDKEFTELNDFNNYSNHKRGEEFVEYGVVTGNFPDPDDYDRLLTYDSPYVNPIPWSAEVAIDAIKNGEILTSPKPMDQALEEWGLSVATVVPDDKIDPQPHPLPD